MILTQTQWRGLMSPYYGFSSIGVAASIRVGNLIGARSPMDAKFAGHMSALLSVVTGLIVMIVLMAAKDVCSELTVVSLSFR